MQVTADCFGIGNVETFSGGSVATAFNLRTVASIRQRQQVRQQRGSGFRLFSPKVVWRRSGLAATRILICHLTGLVDEFPIERLFGLDPLDDFSTQTCRFVL